MNNKIELLCKAESGELVHWLKADKKMLRDCLLMVIVAGAIYGFTLGIWRSPLQGLYVAIKFPLLICLTMFANGLINGMLAQLMGANINFRQSLQAVVMSFALLTIILVAFSPLVLFLVYNLPPMGSDEEGAAHAFFLLSNTLLIALAGVLSNIHLYGLLVKLCGTGSRALQVLFAWLLTNMFLGCQLSWNLRPFFGTPHLPVHFLREHPFENSFYEAVWRMLFA